MGRGLIPQRRRSLLLAGALVLLLPAAAEASDYSDRQLKRSLRSELKDRGLEPKRISRCSPKRDGDVYVCRWRAKGLFPGEVPYKCSGKARFIVERKRWKVEKCDNELDPMVPLMPEPGPHPVFGFNDNWTDHANTTDSTAPQGYPAAAAGAGSDVLRQSLLWAKVEQDQGTYNWVGLGYDSFYDFHLQRRGMRPIWVLHSTPCWARSGPCDQDAPPPPEHLDEFVDFAAAAARRYPATAGFEVWNEPNFEQFWSGGPDPVLYAEMLKKVAAAVHEVNPGIPVIAAGLAPITVDKKSGINEHGMDYERFLREAYRAGGPQSADAIGAHPYPFGSYQDDFLGEIRVNLYRYLRVMAEFGDAAKPIWVTEVGIATWRGFTDLEQADALVRMYALFRRIANVPVLIFHRFLRESNGTGYGVWSRGPPWGSGTGATPAYCAIGAARETVCEPGP
jgi:hypothetical protein